MPGARQGRGQTILGRGALESTQRRARLPKLGVFLPVFFVVQLAAGIVLCIICARKTEGGWRWDGKP